ncbi:MAG: glycosyltransferase [Coleofasciculus sp. G3-WIS-01]|uniref:glycosyltransferase n=1 Tax=Coleofasciculus sp. G3-WIS-01 TaxID=3069528 RepID=UPI0032F4C09B
MSLISVIIPAYNAEKTIEETVESVLNQTFTDFELLIIDDGSQDSTLDIIKRISDPRIQVFSYPNGGANISRNRGLAQAGGEYVAFLDADDLWTPDKLEAQLSALQTNPQAAVAYSWTSFIDESGNFLHKGICSTDTGNVYAKLLLVNFLESGSNPLIRRQALVKIDGFDESLPACQDTDLYLRLAEHYLFTVVPKIQVFYRRSSQSVSSNIVNLELAWLTILERAFTNAPQSLQYLKRHSLANLYKSITYKALSGIPERKQGFLAIKLFANAIRFDPFLLKRRIIWKVLLKITVIVVLPKKLSNYLLLKMENLADLHALIARNRIQV